MGIAPMQSHFCFVPKSGYLSCSMKKEKERKKEYTLFSLSKISYTFSNFNKTIQMSGSWASVWVGEAGGAFNIGGKNVSDTFINSFWYLDQLGMGAKYNTKVYCRQTLTGGNYGLLDTKTFLPNPYYNSALLWHHTYGGRCPFC